MDLPALKDIDRELFYRKHEADSITGVLAEKIVWQNGKKEYGRTRISTIPKLRPLFDCHKDKWSDIELFLLRGGRGSGKSRGIGQLLVLIARSETTRILCTREIQNSIKDSVKKVIENWIHNMGFTDEFTITRESIVHKETGTDFIFMGMRAGTNDESIKGLEDVKYAWVEEAQTMSADSWALLDPTLRVDGRKIFFSYNPRTEHDVVDSIKKMRKAHLIHLNYTDNPFLTRTLYDQAIELKDTNYDHYLHIWEGQAMAEDSSSIILPYSHLTKCIDLHKTYGYGDGQMFAGFDIADGQYDHSDRNSFAARAAATVHRVEEWQIGQVYESVRKVHGWYYELGFSEVNYDAIGVGVAAKSEYARMEADEKEKDNGFTIPYAVNPFMGSMTPMGGDTIFVKHGANLITNAQYLKNVKTQLWWNARLRLQNSMKLLEGHKLDREGYFISFSSKIPNLDLLFSELSQATYKLDGGGRIIVDKAPGYREIHVDGKKKMIKSPNKADSTILSFGSDLEFGLRAHGEEHKKAEPVVIPEAGFSW